MNLTENCPVCPVSKKIRKIQILLKYFHFPVMSENKGTTIFSFLLTSLTIWGFLTPVVTEQSSSTGCPSLRSPTSPSWNSPNLRLWSDLTWYSLSENTVRSFCKWTWAMLVFFVICCQFKEQIFSAVVNEQERKPGQEYNRIGGSDLPYQGNRSDHT